MDVDGIWRLARERHSVYLRRQAGLPREEWTQDPTLARYKFTNVYRELDRTTQWLAQHVREPLKQQPECLLATVLFRWFNRVCTGEAIFLQQQLLPGGPTGDDYGTAWGQYVRGASTDVLRGAVRAYCGAGPYVTGAFMIKGKDGLPKLDGVLWCVEQVRTKRSAFVDGAELAIPYECTVEELAPALLTSSARGTASLEETWRWLIGYPYMGSFMAAQVVADLKYTALLDSAPDWATWAASGPGSRRGLNLVLGRPESAPWREDRWLAALQELQEALLPRFAEQGWTAPHAQDVQNICCEYSKYVRGYSRNRYP